MNNRGTERIREAFSQARAGGSRAVIPYITAGDPDLEQTVQVTEAIATAGADVVEWGIPFSDPLADGGTIQRAAQRSLQGGTTARKVLGAVRQLRERGCQVPLVLMIYVNVILRFGLEAFAAEAAGAGVDGVIVPDVPLEESSLLIEPMRQAGLAWIPLVAPTSPDERIARITTTGDGFVYCVSVTGVTGARPSLARDLPSFLSRVRRHTELPLAVGFGISSPSQARLAGEQADGVIVGSALIQSLEGATSPPERVQRAASFVAGFKEAVQF